MTARRWLLAFAVLGGVALLLVPELRERLLDALFGAEEEFEYTSTTAPEMAGGLPGESDTEY